MADLPEARKIIQIEAVQQRGSLSESLFQDIGANQNFHALKQYDKHSWNLNGPFALGIGSSGLDGVFPFLFDVEITGFWYYADRIGVGTTTIDIDWYDSTGANNGSIFSTLPSVDGTASDSSFTTYRQTDSTTLSNPTGHALAVLSKTTFDAGDVLKLTLTAAQTGASDFQFGIFFRPR
jgi:hypothetical protein